jgi:hypothetical protein
LSRCAELVASDVDHTNAAAPGEQDFIALCELEIPDAIRDNQEVKKSDG